MTEKQLDKLKAVLMDMASKIKTDQDEKWFSEIAEAIREI